MNDLNGRAITTLREIYEENPIFSKICNKLFIGCKLEKNEETFLLSFLVILIDKTNSLEDSYIIKQYCFQLILLYYKNSSNLEPLLSFSKIFGYYPLANIIFKNQVLNFNDILFDFYVSQRFMINNHIAIEEQKLAIDDLLKNDSNFKVFIAPTSYGKSAFIKSEILKRNLNKICIVVPTKALIWQTFDNLNNDERFKSYSILCHDTEYTNQEKIICIFTQERASRFVVENSDVVIEQLFIDEAHEIFSDDSRSILLTRIIKLFKMNNNLINVILLSPFITNQSNLSNLSNSIFARKILTNIKTPFITYADFISNSFFAYERYTDQFYDLKNYAYKSSIEFVLNKAGKKNLLYINSPKNIEKFVKEYLSYLPSLTNMNPIVSVIKKYVHDDYLLVSCLEKGIAYLHADMPDFVKEFIIDKFKTEPMIRFLVANNTVLQGVNYPFDKLFIFNISRLKKSSMDNLIGRINRLNEVFSAGSIDETVEKLLPKIYIINLEESKQIEKISFTTIRKKFELCLDDEVKNPLLRKKDRIRKTEIKEIIDQEENYISTYKQRNIRNIMLENSINHYYKDFSYAINKITSNVENVTTVCDDISKIPNLIKEIFIEKQNLENISSNIKDQSVVRLKFGEAIRFYSFYIKNVFHKSLKTKIKYLIEYFENEKTNNNVVYIGNTFGECDFKGKTDSECRFTCFNPKGKTKSELVNLSIIKASVEDNFISFKIGGFVKALFDLRLIDEKIYNLFFYNSNDEKIISLIKSGVSKIVIDFISDNNLNDDVRILNGKLIVGEKFNDVLDKSDDLIKFTIRKYL